MVPATDQFIIWYFEGLGGFGGWLIFLLLASAAVAWLIYDTQTRRIRALGWRMGASLVALLIIPSVIYRFVSMPTRLMLDQFQNVFFFLGLLGGIIPAVVAVGYIVSYRGIVGCDKGHLYDAHLGACPVCAAAVPPPYSPPPSPPAPIYAPPPLPDEGPTEMPQIRERRPSRQKVGAWLVDTGNRRRYDLLAGDTRIGRKSDANDVVLADPAVSKEHALIREAGGRFTLYDRGSKTGTLVNSKRLRGPRLLEDGDEITVGDTTLKFKVS